MLVEENAIYILSALIERANSTMDTSNPSTAVNVIVTETALDFSRKNILRQTIFESTIRVASQ